MEDAEPESRIAIKSGEEVRIGIVKYGSVNKTKLGGGDMSLHHKKACTKFLQLNQSEGKKNDASFMKSVEEFITRCGGPS